MKKLLHWYREYFSCIDCAESGKRAYGTYGCKCEPGDKVGPPGWWTEH